MSSGGDPGTFAPAGGTALHPSPLPTFPERILLGVDFGVPSVRALEWIAGHFAPRSRVHLVYVVDPAAGPDGPGTGDTIPEGEMRGIEEAAADRLNELARQVSWSRASTEVRVGDPHRELAAAAVAWGAHMVCVGPHTHRGGLRRILGGTAELLLACSPVPVLLAARVHFTPPAHILAAVDDSPVAGAVLAYAGAAAREHGASLDVVRVLDPRSLGRARIVSSHGSARRAEEAARQEASRRLEEAVSGALPDAEKTTSRLLTGRAARRILEVVDERQVDLLVMGTRHGRSVSRVVLGSVARSVLTAAACSVLVVGEQPCPE